MIGLVSIVALTLTAVPFGLTNGNFSQVAGDKAVGWEPEKHYKILPSGWQEGKPSLVAECSGGEDSSGAMQSLRFTPARRGPFKVSAWIKCDDVVDSGGDCSLWLDVFQDGGNPLWGRQGLPDRTKEGWQKVTAEVHPDKPVSEIQIWLLLRHVKGKAAFCDVTIEDLPLTISRPRIYYDGDRTYEVRALISENLPWQISVRQSGKEIRRLRGEGRNVAEHFTVENDLPVTAEITAEREGARASSTVKGKPEVRLEQLDWWIEDSFTRVFQDDLPDETPVKHAVIDAARNERESFQVCLRTRSRKLENVNVVFSDLTAVKSRAVIPHSMLQWRRVGYVYVEQPFAHPFAQRVSSAWWPDPLLPAVKFSVEQGQVQPLWFTVSVPLNASQGKYIGKITITADGVKSIVVPITLTVYPAVIPDQGYMKTAFALMDCYLKRIYGSISPDLRRSYTDYLLAHHLNPDDISRSTPPDLAELEYASKRGLNAFNILNVVEEPEKDTNWTCWSPVEAYTPEFKERFFKKLDQIVPELERRGLIDKAYIYGFDERGPEYIPVIKDIFGEIKKRYPRLHTLSTCWPQAGTDPMSMNIDWYVPLSSSYNPKMAEHVRKRGGEMWWYVCLGPNYPYANWLLENPLIEARLVWWQSFQNDVEGFLYWGLNIWERKNNDAPIPDSAGPRIPWSVTTGGDWASLNGDGVLLYPGIKGPIGSIRMEAIRDGLEDIELLNYYKSKHGSKAVDSILKRVVTDRIRYSRNPEDLKKARLSLLKGL